MTNPRQPADPFAGKLKRTEFQRSASSVPGREIVQVLTEIPGGDASGWHIHPGEEVGYILAGSVEIVIDGQSSLNVHAGEGYLIPPNTPHTARNDGPDGCGMLSTYLVEAGQPLATFVEPGSAGQVGRD